MPIADVRGQHLYYEDTSGAGLPLVLGHGFLMDGTMFEAQVRAFAGSHRVITWDQRGHGRTVSSAEPFTTWDLTDDLAALLDHVGVESAVVGGMSQGGFIALRFALKHPERTTGLVLIDTQSGVEDPEKAIQYDLMHEVWVGSGPSDQLLEMVAAIIIGNRRPESERWTAVWKAREPAGLTQIYRALMDRDDITERLGEIQAPAIVIHGAEDVAIDMSLAESLCSRLAGCRGVVRVEGAGHVSCLTHPEPVNQAIAAFLATIRAREMA
ncbi:MAG TPA: alpha/beta hydrolase [Verrucomicrobiae bacterium]|nr:alpha/beta hydrolase [Verrucomicrobiae bacterium]